MEINLRRGQLKNWLKKLFCSSTKASIMAAVIFVLDKKTDLISAPHALVYLGIVIFFVWSPTHTGRDSRWRRDAPTSHIYPTCLHSNASKQSEN